MSPVDVSVCHSYLRRLDLPLRTRMRSHRHRQPARGFDPRFDKQLIASARKLGVKVQRA